MKNPTEIWHTILNLLRDHDFLIMCAAAFFIGYMCAACKSSRLMERTHLVNFEKSFDIFDTTYIFGLPQPTNATTAPAARAPVERPGSQARVADPATPRPLAIVRHTNATARAQVADSTREFQMKQSSPQTPTSSIHIKDLFLIALFIGIVFFMFRLSKRFRSG